MSQRKSLIDQLLEEAQRRGIYDPHAKVNRPIAMEDETHVPPEDRMAFHLLKSNGFTPPFLMERQTLIHDREKLLQDRDSAIARWAELSVPQRRDLHAALQTRLRELWRRVMDFNLQAPMALHLEGVRIDYELRALVIEPASSASDASSDVSG